MKCRECQGRGNIISKKWEEYNNQYLFAKHDFAKNNHGYANADEYFQSLNIIPPAEPLEEKCSACKGIGEINIKSQLDS